MCSIATNARSQCLSGIVGSAAARFERQLTVGRPVAVLRTNYGNGSSARDADPNRAVEALDDDVDEAIAGEAWT